MKYLISSLFFLFSTLIFAQSVENIEKGLYEHYAKTQKYYYPDEITQKNYQSILDENDIFTAELIYYLKTHPETIENNFSSLVKDYFTLTTSPDGNFRIYSWSINLGGRDDLFYNIFQYRNKDSYGVWKNNYEGNYVIEIFESKLNGKQYYFPYMQSPAHGRLSTQFVYNYYISEFCCEYELSGEDVLFKLGENAESILSIWFDFFSVVDREERPVRLIKFNAKTKTFTLPVIDPQTLNVSLTKTESYKFTGKYFE